MAEHPPTASDRVVTPCTCDTDGDSDSDCECCNTVVIKRSRPAAVHMPSSDSNSDSSGEAVMLRALQEQQKHLVQELSVAEKERDAAQSRLQCAVCLGAERDTVLLPCMHMVVCADCVMPLTQCPVCRSAIHGRMLVLMS